MSLFSMPTQLFILALLAFIIAVPFFAIKHKKLVFIYLFLYTLFLLLGVFLNVNLDNQYITFEFYNDNKWMNANITLAYFNPLSVSINLLLLFPLGIIFPILNKNKSYFFIKIVIIGLVTSIAIETLQFILPINRSPELLDILTNTISIIGGYLYYLLLNKLLRGEKHDQLS